MNNSIKQSLAIACLLFTLCAKSQTSTQSPYSAFGLGSIESKGFAQNMAMGDTKFAIPPVHSINTSNPALYGLLNEPIFDIGIASHSMQLSTKLQTQKNSTLYLKNIALAFPVTKWWSTSFGILPYSSMGYQLDDQSVDSLIGKIDYLYEGKGGINQFYIGNAFTIEDSIRYFSLGFHLSYWFGSLDKYNRIIPNSNANAYNTLIRHTTNVSDFYYDFGLYYKRKINKGLNIGFGLVFAETQNIKAKNMDFTASYTKGIAYDVFKDTVVTDTSNVSITVPNYWGVGYAIEIKDKWIIAMDGFMQDWSSYSFINKKSDLTKRSQLGLGLQFLPDKYAVNRFFKQIKYRMGFSYAQNYLLIRGEKIDEYGISFGFGLPMLNSKSQTTFNIGTELGRRGAITNNLMEEQFMNFYFGFSFTPHKYDRWFIKQKID